MRVVWAQPSITAAEVIARLAANDPTWHPKTVRTLLARLVDKGAVRYEESGRKYVYAAHVSEAECVAAASGSFLERVFGGALTPMVAHFIGRHRLTASELAELRELLDASAAKGPSTPKNKHRP